MDAPDPESTITRSSGDFEDISFINKDGKTVVPDAGNPVTEEPLPRKRGKYNKNKWADFPRRKKADVCVEAFDNLKGVDETTNNSDTIYTILKDVDGRRQKIPKEKRTPAEQRRIDNGSKLPKSRRKKPTEPVSEKLPSPIHYHEDAMDMEVPVALDKTDENKESNPSDQGSGAVKIGVHEESLNLARAFESFSVVVCEKIDTLQSAMSQNNTMWAPKVNVPPRLSVQVPEVIIQFVDQYNNTDDHTQDEKDYADALCEAIQTQLICCAMAAVGVSLGKCNTGRKLPDMQNFFKNFLKNISNEINGCVSLPLPLQSMLLASLIRTESNTILSCEPENQGLITDSLYQDVEVDEIPLTPLKLGRADRDIPSFESDSHPLDAIADIPQGVSTAVQKARENEKLIFHDKMGINGSNTQKEQEIRNPSPCLLELDPAPNEIIQGRDFLLVMREFVHVLRGVIDGVIADPPASTTLWGPNISLPQGVNVTVPGSSADFIEDFKHKEHLTPTDETLADNFFILLHVQLIGCAMNAICGSIKRAIDPSKNGDSVSDHTDEDPMWRNLPNIPNLINEILSEFCVEMSNMKILPCPKFNSLPTTTSLEESNEVSAATTMGMTILDPVHFKEDDRKAGDLVKPPKIILLRDIPRKAPALAQQLIGRKLTDTWGIISGITLTFEDAKDMLKWDYSDAVVNAAGCFIQNQSSFDKTMTRIMYIPVGVMALIDPANEMDFSCFESTITELRSSIGVQTVLAPMHIPEALDHWVLAKINLSSHESPFRIDVFDPFQSTGTIAGQRIRQLGDEEDGWTAADRVVLILRFLRGLMIRAFPTEMDWLATPPEWPLYQTNLIIPMIKPQGSTRECGPILLLALQYYSNDASFNEPSLLMMMKSGSWQQLRYRQFLLFAERIQQFSNRATTV